MEGVLNMAISRTDVAEIGVTR